MRQSIDVTRSAKTKGKHMPGYLISDECHAHRHSACNSKTHTRPCSCNCHNSNPNSPGDGDVQNDDELVVRREREDEHVGGDESGGDGGD